MPGKISLLPNRKKMDHGQGFVSTHGGRDRAVFVLCLIIALFGCNGCAPPKDPLAGPAPIRIGLAQSANWNFHARIAGIPLVAATTDEDIDKLLDHLVEDGATVVEGDSELSQYLDEQQFQAELNLISKVTQRAHLRNLKVIWYYPSLEVLTTNGKYISHTMFKEHPDWVQYNIAGFPNVFVDALERWVKPGEESAWMCHLSPYRAYFFDRIKRIAGTGVEGIWIDVPLFMDTAHKWNCASSYCKARFKADTGLDIPTIEDWSSFAWRRWIAWRHSELNQFQKDVLNAAKTVNPNFELVVEIFSIDYNDAMDKALDGADTGAVPQLTRVWEVDSVSNSTGMLQATEDDWYCKIGMFKFCRGADRGRPSWVFAYGHSETDAELVIAEALAARCNIYETKTPEMATTVGRAFRRRLFSFISENSPTIYDSASSAKVAILYSSTSRDHVDNQYGFGMYYNFSNPADTTWWTAEEKDSISRFEYLAEYRGFTKALVNTHCPFDILPFQHLTSSEMAKYDLLLIPDPVSISDSQVALIRNYVTQGGKVLITGSNPTGLDELGTPRANYALSDVLGFNKGAGSPPAGGTVPIAFGQGKCFFVRDLVGKTYLTQQGAQAQAALNTIQTILNQSTQPLILTGADRRVHMELYGDSKGLILHCVNFIGVNGTMAIVPTGFSVSVTVPSGKTIREVSVMSPDSGVTTGSVPFSLTAVPGKVTFTLSSMSLYSLVRMDYE